MKKKLLGIALLTVLVGPPAFAQMQQVLSIVVNKVAVQGKALTYKGRIYAMPATIPQGGAPRGNYP